MEMGFILVINLDTRRKHIATRKEIICIIDNLDIITVFMARFST